MAGFTISGLCAGSYTVKVNDNGCCGPGTVMVNVKNDIVNGISEDDLEDELTLFPNPVKNVLHIKSKTPIGYFKIFNTNGEAMDVNLKILGSDYELILPELPAGMYLLQCGINDRYHTRKIVVE